MTSRGKTLKLTAVSTLVVLALTGFSTGRGHGGGSGSHDGGGGGGCSSSSQNHDSSSGGSHRDHYDDDDYDDDDYGSGSSGGSEATASPEDATVTLNNEVFADIGMSAAQSRALADSIQTLRRNSGDF